MVLPGRVVIIDRPCFRGDTFRMLEYSRKAKMAYSGLLLHWLLMCWHLAGAGDALKEAPEPDGAKPGGLRADQMARLEEASEEEDVGMLDGAGVVLEDPAPQHISGVSETGAKAGNHAAAAALRARLHGERMDFPHNSRK